MKTPGQVGWAVCPHLACAGEAPAHRVTESSQAMCGVGSGIMPVAHHLLLLLMERRGLDFICQGLETFEEAALEYTFDHHLNRPELLVLVLFSSLVGLPLDCLLQPLVEQRLAHSWRSAAEPPKNRCWFSRTHYLSLQSVQHQSYLRQCEVQLDVPLLKLLVELLQVIWAEHILFWLLIHWWATTTLKSAQAPTRACLCAPGCGSGNGSNCAS